MNKKQLRAAILDCANEELIHHLATEQTSEPIDDYRVTAAAYLDKLNLIELEVIWENM